MNLSEKEISKYNYHYTKAWKITNNYIYLHENNFKKNSWIGRIRTKTAIKHFLIAKELYPNYSIDWGLGKIYQYLGNYKKALNYFEQAFEMESTNVDVAREASISALDILDFEKALFYSDKAIKLNSNDSGLYCHRALIYIFTEKNEKALQYVEKALSIDSNDEINKNTKKYIDNIINKTINRPKHPSEIY